MDLLSHSLNRAACLAFALVAAGLGQPAPHSLIVDLSSFGVRANSPTFNSRLAFQQSLAKLRLAGGGTLLLPAGDLYLDFPDVASDLDPKDLRNASLLHQSGISRDKLLLVPRQVQLQGAVDSQGKPATRVHWKITSVPLLSFVNADGAGARNITFVFDGLQPQFFPWAQEQYLQQVGYPCRWLGGPHELSAVIYAIGSSQLHFENLSFQSSRAPSDNEHTFAFGFVLKGANPIAQPSPAELDRLPLGAKSPGGGLSGCVSHNTLRAIHFEDFVMGILASGQCSPTFENISANHRASWFRSSDPTHETTRDIKNIGPPGHLIYLTFQYAYDLERSAEPGGSRMLTHGTTRNSLVTIRNIREGPDTLSNVNSLGTLALKNIQGGVVEDVSSQHPAGLIQSMVDAHDLRLVNLAWSSDRDICKETPAARYCGLPVITLEPGPAGPELQVNSGVHFQNVRLHSSRTPATFKISQEASGAPLSRDIQVDGLSVECNPEPAENNFSPAVILVRSDSSQFRNVTYLPLVAENHGAAANLVDAARIQSGSRATTIDMQIKRAINVPDSSSAYKCSVEEPAHASNTGGTGENQCHISKTFVN